MTRSGTLRGPSLLLYAFAVLLNTSAAVHGLDELPAPPQPTLPSSKQILAASALPSTCPFRTANYITNTLPQQCLKTNWPGIESYAARLADAGNSTATDSADPEARQPSDAAHSAPSVGGDENHNAVASAAKASDASVNASDAQSSGTPSTETESESPLDNAKFLSFEEWKKLNLERAGQLPENIQQGKAGTDGRLPQDGLNSALNSLGDEGEIDIGFGGFGDAPKPVAASKKIDTVQPDPKARDAPSRKSEAGTTSKERFNYASFDCAATILKTNPKCKSSSSILVENKDSYMLNECSMDNKFLVVELCENIHVDTVVLANFEFFSSMFRAFRISVSDRYPVKADRWKDLGTFEARNSRDIQAFAINDPLIWAKYLRVEFLSQYGNEFYCPVSLLRVHGTTMIEDYNRDMEGRHEDETEDESTAVQDRSPPNPEVQPAQVPEKRDNGGDLDSQPPAPQADGPIPRKMAEDVAVSTVRTATDEAKETDSTASAVVEHVASQPSGGDASLGVATPDAASTKGHTSSDGDTASQAGPGSISTSQNTDDAAATKASKASKQPASVQAAPAPTSTSQESFFKSIHKRLQVLETNATLSLQYIEEQSKILRDAFSKVEKRQLVKTEEFLQHLNDSVRAELKTFRQQYDQLWQSTVIELETHREQYQREIVAVTSRLSIVADELVFQKRMAVVQSTLLLLCLGLVLFVRTGGSALDLPLMQNVLNKSHSMLGLQFDSPVMSPFAKQGRGRSSEQLASGESSRTPSLSPSPPPKKAVQSHYRSPSIKGANGTGLAGAMADGAAGHGRRRGSRSGPATPTGRRRVRADREDSLEWGSVSSSNSAAEESPSAASRGNATD